MRELAGKIASQIFACEFAVPARDDESGYAVADHIDEGAEHTHEAVDAENQRHASDGDGRNYGERRNQCNEGSSLVRTFQAQVQTPERSIVEASSFPDLDKPAGEAIKYLVGQCCGETDKFQTGPNRTMRTDRGCALADSSSGSTMSLDDLHVKLSGTGSDVFKSDSFPARRPEHGLACEELTGCGFSRLNHKSKDQRVPLEEPALKNLGRGRRRSG